MSFLCSKTFSGSPFPTMTQPFVAEGTLGWESAGWVLEQHGLPWKRSRFLILAMPETHCQTWDRFLDLCFLVSNGLEGWGFGVVNSKHKLLFSIPLLFCFQSPYPSADSGVFELWHIFWHVYRFSKKFKKNFLRISAFFYGVAKAPLSYP